MINDPLPVWSRRDFLRRSGQSSLAALGSLSLARNAWAMPDAGEDGVSRARGTVFLDANGSGRAEGQQVLPGILVSNGVEVVETDRNGRYELPVTDDTIIHVIKPRGYRTTVDALNLPRFYYIHKPDGSPDEDFIYKGVAATGPLPDEIDFPLYPQDESDDFEMIFTADPQCYNLQQIHWYAAETTREFRRHKPAFGIALGDIVGDHLDLYEPYNAINAQCGFPWHNVIGNHDLNFMAPDDRHSAETFTRVFGPTTYAFQYARVHFIVLNNVFWEGFEGLRDNGWPHNRKYHGRIRPEQLDYIRNYLRHVPADDRIVVCSHIPMDNRIGNDIRHATPEFGELLRLLSGHRFSMSFSGHNHVNANSFHGADDGYDPPGGNLHHHCNLTATCGSWYRGPLDHNGVPYSPGRDGSPKGYAVVRFEGADTCTVRVIGLGRPEDEKMSVQLPSLVERADLGGTDVQVNVFDGSDRTQVRARIGDEPWMELERTKEIDRRFAALQRRADIHPEVGRGRLPGPIFTDHIWTVPLPGDLEPGWHTLTVEVEENGADQRWTDKRTFVVAESASDLELFDQGVLKPRNVEMEE